MRFRTSPTSAQSPSRPSAPPNCPSQSTHPCLVLPQPALEPDNSVSSRSMTPGLRPQLTFPDHVNGHFLGALDDAQPVLAGYNFPLAPTSSSSYSTTTTATPPFARPHLHSQQSSASFTQNNHSHSGSTPPALKMSDPHYPTSFDSTPHFMNPPQASTASGQVNTIMDQTRPAAAANQFGHGYQGFPGFNGPAAQLTSAFGNLHLNPPGNLPHMNINSYPNPTNNMMLHPAAGSGQSTFQLPTLGATIPQNIGWNGAGLTGYGFIPRASNQPTSQVQYWAQYYNTNDHMDNSASVGLDIGEAGISGSNMFFPTTPPGTRYTFGPTSPPPFIDLTRFTWPSNMPVIKISNIPFNVTKDEIAQFLRRGFLPHNNGAIGGAPLIIVIHIIMERTNAKTNDCYVELDNFGTKDIVLGRYDQDILASRAPKIGQRHVTIEASNQQELMMDVFPRAQSIVWGKHRCFPVRKSNDDPYASGFAGFLTEEELSMMVRFTLQPERNPYGSKSPQRTFETMIMTLTTFPWASPYYTFADCQKLWKAYLEMLNYLVGQVNGDQRVVGLNQRLHDNYVTAGIKCPGFALWQKARILEVTGADNIAFGVSGFAKSWPFNCLGLPAGISDQDVGQWLDLLNNGAKAELQRMRSASSYRRKLSFGLNSDGQVQFHVTANARNVGFRDIAQAEYQVMLELVGLGWDKWFIARGMDADVGEVRIPDLSARMDMGLNEKMFDVGVYAEGGLGGSSLMTAYYLGNLHDGGNAVESDDRDIDEILREEDARAIAASAEMEDSVEPASPSLTEIFRDEDARAAAASPEPGPAESDSPEHVTPVKFQNPFQGSEGGSPMMGTLSYSTVGSGMVNNETGSGRTETNTGAGRAVRKSSAIPIRAPKERQESIGASPKTQGEFVRPARKDEGSRSV